MRYWLYKWNTRGSPTGWSGDWGPDIFDHTGEQDIGGHRATGSPVVERLLDEEVRVGDVIVAYQTDDKAVVGFCRLARITGHPGDLTLHVEAIHRLANPFRIHEQKHGSVLADSAAVHSQYMLSELEKPEMEALVRLSGAPNRVLKGQGPVGGHQS